MILLFLLFKKKFLKFVDSKVEKKVCLEGNFSADNYVERIVRWITVIELWIIMIKIENNIITELFFIIIKIENKIIIEISTMIIKFENQKI